VYEFTHPTKGNTLFTEDTLGLFQGTTRRTRIFLLSLLIKNIQGSLIKVKYLNILKLNMIKSKNILYKGGKS